MNATTHPYRTSEIPEPHLTRLLFADTRLAPLWLIVRLYIGYEWLMAGWEKLNNSAGVWVGAKAGAAGAGFAKGALEKTTGVHPDVTGWYASFLQNVVVPNATLWSYMVTFGEILVGWRVAGHWGLDRWALPLLGVPGRPGTLFHHQSAPARARGSGQPTVEERTNM